MTEEELNASIKVLVNGAVYHWRDALNRALCDRTKGGDLVSLKERPAGTFLCPKCEKAVEIMTEGWN